MSYRAQSRYLINENGLELFTQHSRSEIAKISTPLNHHNIKNYNENNIKQTI